MNSYNPEDISLEILNNNDKNNFIRLQDFLHQLDTSFEPYLSSYVHIESFAEKLMENAKVIIMNFKGSFAGLSAVYVNNNKTKIAYWTSLAVKDKYKGCGFAQLLADQTFSVSRKSGMHAIKLEVKSSYPRAVRFYEKNGFVKSDEETKDDSSFYMYKSLNDK